MKKNVSTLLILLLIINISCKNNNKAPIKEEVKAEEVVVVPKQLSIDFNFKTNKADVFKIMMNNIQVDDLQKKNVHIFENVAPSSTLDKIMATFGEDEMSKNIAIHLGNQEIKEVEISSIEVSYGDNLLSIKTPQDIDKYIVFNKFIQKDPASNVLKTIRVSGQHNPVFSFKHNLINFLTKE